MPVDPGTNPQRRASSTNPIRGQRALTECGGQDWTAGRFDGRLKCGYPPPDEGTLPTPPPEEATPPARTQHLTSQKRTTQLSAVCSRSS